MEFNLPKIDLESAEEGKWFDLTDKISLKIAKDNNENHERALQAKIKIIEKHRANSKYSNIKSIINHIISETILKDWKGVTDDKGKELTYTPELGYTMLSDPRHEEVKSFIIDSSQEKLEYESVEAEIKN